MINQSEYKVKMMFYKAFYKGTPMSEKHILDKGLNLNEYIKNNNFLDDLKEVYKNVMYEKAIYRRTLSDEKEKYEKYLKKFLTRINFLSNKRKLTIKYLERINHQLELVEVEFDVVQDVYDKTKETVISLSNKLILVNSIPQAQWDKFEGLNMTFIDISKYKSIEDIEMYYESLTNEYVQEYLADLRSDATNYDVDISGKLFAGRDEVKEFRKEVERKHHEEIAMYKILFERKDGIRQEIESFVQPLIKGGLSIDEIENYMINRELA